MVGQQYLKQHFARLIENRALPKLLILIGPKGQGKRTLINYISAESNIAIYKPTDVKVDSIREIIEDSQTLHRPRIYLLENAEDMTIPAQNALLKLAEEPPQMVHIAITVDDQNHLLPTIISRGQSYKMEAYTANELKQFTHNEMLLKICTNPGMIQRLKDCCEPMLNMCNKVVDNIGKISSANAFNIIKHFHVDNYDLVIPMLLHVYGERLVTGQERTDEIRVLCRYKNQVESKSINTANALEMLFLDLREAAICSSRS